MAGKAYAGVVWRDDGGSRLVAANITPDPETGAGRWSDDMLARAIREGIGHDGRLLHPQMWYRSFRELSDEDLAAVIVYLRSLPPVRNPLPKTVLSDEQVERHVGAPKPITAPVAAPPQDTPTARGRYLVALADCSGCHTYWEGPRMPGAYAGGNHIERGEHGAFSTNITPHASGMGYDTAAFIDLMRTGKAGLTKPVMPWIAFRNLSDEDLAAIHAFLGTRHPVAHHVGNLAGPSQCEVCGQQHGLGSLNKREPLSGIALPQSLLESYVGTYRLEEFDWTLRISLAHGVLHAHDADLPAKPLFALTESRFVMEDGLGPLRFNRDQDGRVVSVTSEDTDDIVLSRITGKAVE
jgi:mono/diheme cytochrome c family protein